MAKKKVTAIVKLQCPAGKATPAPPVGPALGPHGVSAPQFCQQFNDRTKGMEAGLTIPVIITVYGDKTFTFITKTPPASVLIKKAIGLDKGSPIPHKQKVGKISKAKIDGDRQGQDGGPVRQRPGGGFQDHRRNGPQHGRGSGVVDR